MIGWLQGQKIETWQQGTRQGVLLACGGVGYEVQMPPRQLKEIRPEVTISLWVHQIQREDGFNIFGFIKQEERDLFRTLITVSGVGPQVGVALIEEFKLKELIEAIVQGNLKKLTQAQGVGKRTAERLAVELREKLSELSTHGPSRSLVEAIGPSSSKIDASNLEELQSILSSLGYEDLEIRRAIGAITSTASESQNSLSKAPSPDDIEGWLRASLLWLTKSPD